MKERKTRIKLFATDLDRTLVDDSGRISAFTMDTIRNCMGEGFLFTFATGRQASAMWRLRDIIPVNAPAICSNGSEIVDVFTGKVYHRETVPSDFILEFVEFCLKNGIDFDCRADKYECANVECVYLPVMLRRQKEALAAGRDPQGIFYIRDVSELPNGGEYVKLLAWTPNDRILHMVREFCDGYPEVTTTSSVKGLFEIAPAGNSKGSGVTHLCEVLGLNKDEVCVFGDYINDLPMFRAAGMSVAVDNADDQVKQRATFVTDSNNDDGVAKAVLRICSGEFG
ncbi:MAG: HAD family hydrolase [Oscillospiraceae bacterium]|nr:HAD family hydrolase [Oscillospiraceae bacterium]